MSTWNDSLIGTTIGRYVIRESLGSGSLVSVWLADDPDLARTVALKLFIGALARDRERYQAMFEAEARLLARLEHSNILPIYDYGLYDGHPFYVMRYVPDGDLQEILSARTFSAIEALHITERLASAITYVHNQGIIHRDIKPSNIMLDADMQPYLVDFALAFLPDDMTPEGTAAGTPLYMAPEVLHSGHDTHLRDIFSFGLVVFELLTNRRPIPETVDTETLESLFDYRVNPANPQLPRVRETHPDIPIAVDAVLARMTHSDPASRYPSAVEAAAALRQAFTTGGRELQGKVFISYSRQDAAYVYALAEQLASAGVDIWIDREIEPGRHWDENIEEALDECAMMLLVLSPASVESENVHDEWNYVLENQKPVYPLVLAECKIPFRLRRRQHIYSTGDPFGDLAPVIEMLASGSGGN